MILEKEETQNNQTVIVKEYTDRSEYLDQEGADELIKQFKAYVDNLVGD